MLIKFNSILRVAEQSSSLSYPIKDLGVIRGLIPINGKWFPGNERPNRPKACKGMTKKLSLSKRPSATESKSSVGLLVSLWTVREPPFDQMMSPGFLKQKHQVTLFPGLLQHRVGLIKKVYFVFKKNPLSKLLHKEVLQASGQSDDTWRCENGFWKDWTQVGGHR